MIHSQKHSGVAAVEAAFCLPLLVFIFFGSLEISGGIFQEYNAQAAAFELSKVALTRLKTCDDVQALATQILPQQEFTSYSITIAVEPRTVNGDSVQTPSITLFSIPQSGPTTPGFEELPRGTLLRLTLTVERPPIGGMGLTRNFLDQQIVSDCVFVKEF
jgi:Flp pilus assembly protein TadG